MGHTAHVQAFLQATEQAQALPLQSLRFTGTEMFSPEAIDEWLRRLHRLGYKTRELRLNAEHFGVAHSRRRLVVVADREREPASVATIPPLTVPKDER